MSLKFGQIQPWTGELAALDQFKKIYLRIFKIFDDLLSGERSLPFGLLVLVIGKAQFRRALLSCDSSCYSIEIMLYIAWACLCNVEISINL